MPIRKTLMIALKMPISNDQPEHAMRHAHPLHN
jgi:hypothetical protein